MRLRKTTKTVPLAGAALLTASAWLATGQAQADDNPGNMNFALFIENEQVEFTYDDGRSLDTRSTRLKATWDNALNHWLRGGLNLAYLDVTQANNSVESARNTVGYGLGINLRALALAAPMLRLAFFLDYDYQATQGSVVNQSTDMNWNEIEAGMDLTLLPHAPAAILLGISGTSVWGRQKDRGILDRVIDFRQADMLGYYAGVHIRTAARGGIGLKAYGGRSQGLYFYFSRRF